MVNSGGRGLRRPRSAAAARPPPRLRRRSSSAPQLRRRVGTAARRRRRRGRRRIDEAPGVAPGVEARGRGRGPPGAAPPPCRPGGRRVCVAAARRAEPGRGDTSSPSARSPGAGRRPERRPRRPPRSRASARRISRRRPAAPEPRRISRFLCRGLPLMALPLPVCPGGGASRRASAPARPGRRGRTGWRASGRSAAPIPSVLLATEASSTDRNECEVSSRLTNLRSPAYVPWTEKMNDRRIRPYSWISSSG